jgi:hypothetical protein
MTKGVVDLTVAIVRFFSKLIKEIGALPNTTAAFGQLDLTISCDDFVHGIIDPLTKPVQPTPPSTDVPGAGMLPGQRAT